MAVSVRSVLRSLAPSGVAACAGALIAGTIEGVTSARPLAVVATAGFFALVAIPVLLAMSLVVRGLFAAWQPGELAARLREDDGAMPRLAGWVITIWLAALLLAWVTFQTTWLLARWTAFKPLVVGFAQPVIAVGTVLLVVAVSRPAVAAFTALARRIDRRWRRHGRGTLLTARKILVGAAVVAMITTYVLWRVVVRQRLGTFDPTLLYTPVLAGVVTWLLHVAWTHLGRARRFVVAAITGGAAIAIVVAVITARTQPATVIEIWGARPIAGLAIEWFDLDRIRDEVPLDDVRPSARPGAQHPDIVLVTIDTLRADRTPPYGGPTAMPVLRELGERGTVFSWAFAPSNVTRRSIPSMITGTAPNRIKGRVAGWALRLDPRHVLLAERMQAGGYETAGFMCCKGFWGPEARTGWQRGLEHLTIEPDGRKLAEEARSWLAQRRARKPGKPLFLWIHLLEPHNWAPAMGTPVERAERLALYDRTLEASDHALARLLGGFTEKAPIVIVTSDHGEAIGDHDQPTHSTDLYNSQIRVPLVIAGPGIKPARIAESVSLTDLTPTILELAGFLPPKGPGIDGRSLADLATGLRAPELGGGHAFSAMIEDRSNPGGLMALVQGRWKLIENGEMYELYDLQTDASELANHVTVRPDLVVQLRRILDLKKAAAKKSPF